MLIDKRTHTWYNYPALMLRAEIGMETHGVYGSENPVRLTLPAPAGEDRIPRFAPLGGVPDSGDLEIR
jgi:hypothetical protein